MTNMQEILKKIAEDKGAVDRMMNPVVTQTANSILPQAWQKPVLNHYNKYQDLYNAGALGLAGTAAYKGLSSLFGGDDDDEVVVSKRRRGGNGIGSWLLPMAVIGGGAYLLNRYGNKIGQALLSPKQQSGLRTGTVVNGVAKHIPVYGTYHRLWTGDWS